MPPTIAELIGALPADEPPSDLSSNPLVPLLTQCPVPTGALRRLGALGGLQAQVALAYLVYWVRGWFQDADARERSLLETHLRAALRLLNTMGYLRGAVMKVGQALANFPDILPEQFVETLAQLHFQAPPMHFSLLREQVRNELGQDPEELFDTFETRAFAAASLGQVHRARLKTGEPVAVKIQYPGIGRAVRSDFRNLAALIWPARLSRDGDSVRDVFEEIRRLVAAETDYEKEAQFLHRARAAFDEDDRIIVPRVYDAYSTRRVLTMEDLGGQTFDQFLSRNPSQEDRDAVAAKMVRAGDRLLFRAGLLYADPHPGNYLFLSAGRLGLVDFGCMRPYQAADWELMRRAEAAMAGRRELVDYVKFSCELTDQEAEAKPELVNAVVDYIRWFQEVQLHDGAFDFGDLDYLRRGIRLYIQVARTRHPRVKPVVLPHQRAFFGLVALLYRLHARVDFRAITEEEARARTRP